MYNDYYLIRMATSHHQKGIFDIVDIVLNVCGVVIGVILDVVCKGVKTWTKIHAEKRP